MDETNIRTQFSATSDSNSEESARNETITLPLDKRLCLVGNAVNDPATCRAAQCFGVPVLTSETGREYISDVTCTTVFVLDDFEQVEVKELQKPPHRILGAIALQQLADRKEKLPNNTRPLYNVAMMGVVVCFTGFRKKEDLTRLIPLIHHMGGSIRKDMAAKVTHLIANCCGGDKYHYATLFKVPIMSHGWVTACWEQRQNIHLIATDDAIISAHKLKPFYGARVCFVGFSKDETKHMHEVLEANGGQITDLDDPLCTHVVMENGESYTILSPRTNPTEPVLSPSFFPEPTTSSATTPAPLYTITESPQKRRHIDDTTEHEFSSKKRRRNSMYEPSSSKSRFKDILKTPVNLFTRRKSVTATVTAPVEGSEQVTPPVEGYKPVTPPVGEGCKSVASPVDSLAGETFLTPRVKYKSFFKKGFRKSFNALKHISEHDPNESLDDIDVSVCKSGGTTPVVVMDVDASVCKSEGMSPGVGMGARRRDVEGSFVSSSQSPLLVSWDAAGQDGYRFSTSSAPVVDESSVTERPDAPSKALLVKAEWFWASVQNVACAEEKDYLFDDYLDCIVSPGRRDSHATTPSGSSRRKRKRLHETLSSLVRNDSPAIHKRRSSISDAGLLSVSGSFLDCTASPDKTLDQTEATAVETPRKNLSPRQQVFLELVQTESNYVNILKTIMVMFKSHLEEMPEPEALLNNTELKIIFGNLPPIYETHSKMLEELRWASLHWSEDTSIGNIILKYANDLLKAYPPFVNFFETMKEMLIQCDLSKPRFHAFLKICQTRPECGRQSLQDLLIRPVQRLPSISLLLNDILKHTNKSNSDNTALEKALSAIKEVMTHINEDKRKTEGQRVMFDIFNEIDNCPPDLVSSHRSFITRCEVTEISDNLSGRGNPLVLFLFTDQLEVCKKRSKAFNTLKSPNSVANGFHTAKPSAKPYKHVSMMALNTIKRVIDIHETEECQKVFALVTRDHQELKEKLFSFTMTEEDSDKAVFLKTLCRHIANTAYSADAEKFLAYLEPQELDIDTSDVTMGTLSKAFKFATRTRIKVGRAFSFNKTPSKLKRAMSTMMSPFGSSTNITPASQLANMRLASYNNINELGSTTDSGDTPSGEPLVAPMSVQPTRKLKCSSLSVTALKRL